MNNLVKLKRSQRLGFAQLVEEALAMTRASRAVKKFGDERDGKLSRQTYLKIACRNGNTDPAKLRKLDALLAQDEASHPWINKLLHGTRRVAEATRADQGCALHPPSSNLHMLLGPGDQSIDFTNLLMETMQYASTPLEIVALGVLQATERRPDAFGIIDDPEAHEQQASASAARWLELMEEIPQAATYEDYAITWLDAKAGTAQLTFRWKGEDTGISAGDPEALVLEVL